MKKLVYGLGFALAIGLASCGGVDGKIKDYKELNNKLSELRKAEKQDKENLSEQYEIMSKMASIKADLTGKDLTKKQIEDFFDAAK